MRERGISMTDGLYAALKQAAEESGRTVQAVVSDVLDRYLRTEPRSIDFTARFGGRKTPRMVRVDDWLYSQVEAVAHRKGVSVSRALELGYELAKKSDWIAEDNA